MIWAKEKALSTLIRNVSNEKQMEYNLGRAQLGVIGYSVEEFHKKFCSEYSEAELQELSDNYLKSLNIVLKEYNDNVPKAL